MIAESASVIETNIGGGDKQRSKSPLPVVRGQEEEAGASDLNSKNSGIRQKIGKKRRDEDIKQRIRKRKKDEKMFDILLSGCSVTLLVHTPKKIYVGYVGDSLVALQGSEKNISQQFIKSTDLFMTYPPHKPDLPNEKVRIYNKRGEIRESPIDGKCRIYVRARMYPALDTSRSIGDLICHQVGVKSEPEIRIHEVLQHDKFFVMGTSSLWQFLGPEEVIEIINEYEAKEQGLCTDIIM